MKAKLYQIDCCHCSGSYYIVLLLLCNYMLSIGTRDCHFRAQQNFYLIYLKLVFTAIPYRASTGPEKGFPCVVFPHREKPVFLAWIPVMKTGFSLLEILRRENPVFITGMGLQCAIFFGS